MQVEIVNLLSNPTFLTDITNVSTCLINVIWEFKIRFLSTIDEKRIVDSRFPFPDVDLHLPFSVGKQKKKKENVDSLFHPLQLINKET